MARCDGGYDRSFGEADFSPTISFAIICAANARVPGVLASWKAKLNTNFKDYVSPRYRPELYNKEIAEDVYTVLWKRSVIFLVRPAETMQEARSRILTACGRPRLQCRGWKRGGSTLQLTFDSEEDAMFVKTSALQAGEVTRAKHGCTPVSQSFLQLAGDTMATRGVTRSVLAWGSDTSSACGESARAQAPAVVLSNSRVQQLKLGTERTRDKLAPALRAFEEKCGRIKQLFKLKQVEEHPGVALYSIPIKHRSKFLLGEGAFGKVFLGVYNGTPIAVKVMGTSQHQEISNLKSILDGDGASLRVVKYVADWSCSTTSATAPQEYNLAMELCACTLAQRMKVGPVDQAEQFSLLFQITEGLAFLHQQKFVHRDLHPSNVMFTKHGNVKLVDFGLTREFRPDASRSYVETASKPRESLMPFEVQRQLVETPDADCFEIRQPSDIFQLGEVFFFIISNGKYAFSGSTDITQEEPCIRQQGEPLMELVGPYQDLLKPLLVDMLHHDHRQRPTIEQIQEHPYMLCHAERTAALSRLRKDLHRNSALATLIRRDCDCLVPDWTPLIPECFRTRFGTGGTGGLTGIAEAARYVRNVEQHLKEHPNVCRWIVTEWVADVNSGGPPVNMALDQPEEIVFHHPAFAWLLAAVDTAARTASRVVQLYQARSQDEDDGSGGEDDDDDGDDGEGGQSPVAGSPDRHPYQQAIAELEEEEELQLDSEARDLLVEVGGDKEAFLKRMGLL